MSARSRGPTDNSKTEIFESDNARARRVPTQPPPLPPAPKPVPKPPVVAAPVPRDRSEEIRVISMKTPAELAAERTAAPARAELPKVQLRAMGEVARHRSLTPPMGFGNLAPPRDPKEARERRWWSNTFWGSIAVIIASLVALAIWLLAGRR